MGRQKISLPELGECLRQGKTVTEIAREFGMTGRGVRKKVKGLHLKISQTATLHQAGLILGQQIDANAQLLKINNSVHKLWRCWKKRKAPAPTANSLMGVGWFRGDNNGFLVVL